MSHNTEKRSETLKLALTKISAHKAQTPLTRQDIENQTEAFFKHINLGIEEEKIKEEMTNLIIQQEGNEVPVPSDLVDMEDLY